MPADRLDRLVVVDLAEYKVQPAKIRAGNKCSVAPTCVVLRGQRSLIQRRTDDSHKTSIAEEMRGRVALG